MHKSVAFLALALFVDNAMTCEVLKSDLVGDYEYASGLSQLSYLALFWEDGSYIFNADSKAGDELVGEWSYAECTLNLYHFVDDVKQTERLEVIALEHRVLVVRITDEKTDVRFNKVR
jgi:hypothetical protein